MSVGIVSARAVEANNTPLSEYVRIASDHYGDLNPQIIEATTPQELVHELHVAREEALRVSCTKGHTEEYKSIYWAKAVSVLTYLTQVRHEFHLAIGGGH